MGVQCRVGILLSEMVTFYAQSSAPSAIGRSRSRYCCVFAGHRDVDYHNHEEERRVLMEDVVRFVSEGGFNSFLRVYRRKALRILERICSVTPLRCASSLGKH